MIDATVNGKIILVLIGLLIGGVVGYLQRPEAAEIKIGPIQLEVQTDQVAQGNGPLTSGQMRHVLIFAIVGGAIGLAIGYVADRRKRV